MWLVESGFEKVGWAVGMCMRQMDGGCNAAGNGKHLSGTVLSTNVVMPPDSILPTLLRNLELVLGKYQSHIIWVRV